MAVSHFISYEFNRLVVGILRATTCSTELNIKGELNMADLLKEFGTYMAKRKQYSSYGTRSSRYGTRTIYKVFEYKQSINSYGAHSEYFTLDQAISIVNLLKRRGARATIEVCRIK